MHLADDHRDLEHQQDDEDRHGKLSHNPLDPASDETVLDDSEALKLRGKDSLVEEEGVEADEEGGD